MSLHLYLGPMWSGKTSRLIGEYQRWTCIGKPSLVINHMIDSRYGNDDYLYTHDKIKIPCVLVDKLDDVPIDRIHESEAVFINEGQFFIGLKSTILHWVEDLGKHVYIVGLDGDRNREKFGELLDLIPYADYYEKLRAKCKICLDGTNALFTHDQEQSDGTIINNESEQIKVGSEQYLPLCRHHYLTSREKTVNDNDS